MPSWQATTPNCVDFSLWGGRQGGQMLLGSVGSSPQIDPSSVQGQAMITPKDIPDAYNNG